MDLKAGHGYGRTRQLHDPGNPISRSDISMARTVVLETRQDTWDRLSDTQRRDLIGLSRLVVN